MSIIDLRKEFNKDKIKEEFERKNGKKVADENLQEFADFSIEYLLDKFINVMDEYAKFNGELEKRIEVIEKVICHKE